MTHMWQEIMDQPGVLRNALEQNYKTIEDLVALLKEKKIRHVVIAARGTSHHAAVYAKYTIEIKLGLFCLQRRRCLPCIIRSRI